MRKFTRTETPDFLTEKWELWGERFYRNKTSNQSYKFQWPTIKKQPVNRLLEPLLAYQTQGHCSYCDRYPLRSREDSIDHFKPKSKRAYHRIAFHWNNLY
jgi:hypothetical protein